MRKSAANQNSLTDDSFNESIQQVIDYVQNNYSEKLTLKDVATQFHYHPAYLGRAFKKKQVIPFMITC
ncbi:AraC family transcriptional regulator [Enterococcus faecium]|nr:AraC family transcriptional regulator [Enterococcus faecium]MCC9085600.1 AraC family transcriptional regulator [Enterococcus faecium]